MKLIVIFLGIKKFVGKMVVFKVDEMKKLERFKSVVIVCLLIKFSVISIIWFVSVVFKKVLVFIIKLFVCKIFGVDFIDFGILKSVLKISVGRLVFFKLI